MMENKEAEKKTDKQLLDHKGRIREISDTIKQNNWDPRRARRERERGRLYWRTSLIWGRKQASKSRRHREFPSKISKNRTMHQHRIVKLTNLKRQRENLESSLEKEVCNLQG